MGDLTPEQRKRHLAAIGTGEPAELPDPTPANVEQTPDETRQKLIQRLRDELGRLGPGGKELADRLAGTFSNGKGRGSRYGLVLADDAEIQLGTVTDLMRSTACQEAVLEEAGVAIAAPKRADWAPIAGLIVRCAEVRNRGVKSTEETCIWIGSFLREDQGRRGLKLREVDLSDAEEAYEFLSHGGEGAFRADGRLYLRIDSLHAYVVGPHIGLNTRCSIPDLANRLAELRFTRDRLEQREPGAGRGERPAKLRVWCSEPGFDPDDFDENPVCVSPVSPPFRSSRADTPLLRGRGDTGDTGSKSHSTQGSNPITADDQEAESEPDVSPRVPIDGDRADGQIPGQTNLTDFPETDYRDPEPPKADYRDVDDSLSAPPQCHAARCASLPRAPAP